MVRKKNKLSRAQAQVAGAFVVPPVHACMCVFPSPLSHAMSRHHAMHLPAGVTYVLGHQHIDATCPWCRDVNYAVSIPHLLRDCTFWAPDRQRMVTDMRRAAIAQGMTRSTKFRKSLRPTSTNVCKHWGRSS